MARSWKWDFFISYARRDRQWAEWIAWSLEAAGYRVLIQAWDMVPGTNWVLSVEEGVRLSERTIAVMSKAYLKSDWTQVEAQVALRRDPLGRERRLLPVRIEECRVEGLLGLIVRIDLFGRSESDARQALLDGVRQAARGRAKPDPSWSGQEAGSVPGFPDGVGPKGSELRMALALDVEGLRSFSAERRQQVRARVLAMLFAGLDRAGVRNSDCMAVDRVEGLAVIFPAGFSGPIATEAVLRELCVGVVDLGRGGRGTSPVQTRVALAAGTVDLSSPTFEGTATATASRLVSSGQVRIAALRSSRTPNVVVVADDLYLAAAPGPLPAEFLRIPISATEHGWIALIPGIATPLSTTASQASPPTGLAAAVAATVGVATISVLAAEEWQHLGEHDVVAASIGGPPAHVPEYEPLAEQWQNSDGDWPDNGYSEDFQGGLQYLDELEECDSADGTDGIDSVGGTDTELWGL